MWKKLEAWWTLQIMTWHFKRALRKKGKVSKQYIKENAEGMKKVMKIWLDHI